jgi:hypothetical protein
MSCRYIEAENGGRTSSPLVLTCLNPCTSLTIEPSANTHHILTGGYPVAVHTITAPEVFEKCTLDGGSTMNRGPV